MDSKFAPYHRPVRSPPGQVLCTRPNPAIWSRPLSWNGPPDLVVWDEWKRLVSLAIERLERDKWLTVIVAIRQCRATVMVAIGRNKRTKIGSPLMYSIVSSSTRFRSLSNPLRIPVTSRPPWNFTLMLWPMYLVRSTIDSFFFCWGADCCGCCCCAGLTGAFFGCEEKERIELVR